MSPVVGKPGEKAPLILDDSQCLYLHRFLNYENIRVRGLEISANHVKSVKDGFVYAKASALHKGKTTQLWQIRIENEFGELISMLKLTTISFYD